MAKKYTIDLNPTGWYILRDDFTYEKKSFYKGFDKKDIFDKVAYFGQSGFIKGVPIYIYDPFPINDNYIEKLKQFEAMNIPYSFIGINTTYGANEKISPIQRHIYRRF